jgi:hypothetical protein
MAQKPLEEGMTGPAPIVAAKLPRAHQARLREMASEQGLTVSALVRQLLGQALSAAQGEDHTIRRTREARGHHTPGLPNADYQRYQLGHDDRNSQCPTISTTITATSDG